MRAGKYGGTISWRIVDSKDEDHTDGQGALAGVNLLEENHPAKTGKPSSSPTSADCLLPVHLKGKSLKPILKNPKATVKPAAFTVSHAREHTN